MSPHYHYTDTHSTPQARSAIMNVHTHQSGFGVSPRHVSRSGSRDTFVTNTQPSCDTIPVIIPHQLCPQSLKLPAICLVRYQLF